MDEQKTQDFICTQSEDPTSGRQTTCYGGPCKLTVKAGISPYRCANFDSHNPVWEPLAKASYDATYESCEKSVPTVDTESEAEAYTSTNAVYDYERFQGKIVPKFGADLKALFIQDNNNIDRFMQGNCSLFRPICRGFTCEDCLMRVYDPDSSSCVRICEWLQSKGYIEIPEAEDEHIDAENIEPEECTDIEGICAKATELETKIIDNLGCTASPEEIVEFLKSCDPSVDELYALIAVKLTT